MVSERHLLGFHASPLALLVVFLVGAGCASSPSRPRDGGGSGADSGVAGDSATPLDSSGATDSGAPLDSGGLADAGDTGVDSATPGCASLVCDPNAICVDRPAGPECECLAGFTGDGMTCADVDECVPADPCGMGMCVNAPGSYSCGCDLGYSFDGVTCVDVDECVPTDPCGMGTCTNEAGSYGCTCPASYRFDGTTCVMVAGTVLVFRGSTRAADTTGADAVTGLGLTLIETTTDTQFNAAYDAGGFDVIVWGSPSGTSSSTVTAAVEARLTSWIAGGGSLIFSYWDLDTETSLRVTLGVTTVSRNTWANVVPAPGAPEDFFTGVPNPLTGADSGWADNGDNLALAGAGFVAATFVSGSPTGAILVTNGNRVITNGFVFSDCLTQDVDGDSVPDCQELLQNQISYLLP